MITAINNVITVVKLYKSVILLLLLCFVDSHKSCDIIIHSNIPSIAIIEMPNNRHIEKLLAICHMVVNIKPNAPVVKAMATMLLKLAIIFNGLLANVIPLTNLNMPLDLELDK